MRRELKRGWFMQLTDDGWNAWYWLTDRPRRMVTALAFALGCLLLGSWLATCVNPAFATADNDPSPRFTVSTAKVSAGVFRLYIGISCGGSGPDSVHLQTRSPLTGNVLTHKLTGCPARDSFDMSARDSR